LSTSDSFIPLVRTIDLLLAEQQELAAGGPLLAIDHRFQEPSAISCRPGEEISLVSLNCAGHYVPLKLSLVLRILVDYLARHRNFPQSASQIEAGIQADSFYSKHASNARALPNQIRRIRRSAVKVYVQRFRHSLKAAALAAGMALDPSLVLLSEPTDSNEVLYRLKARVEWRHSQQSGVRS
jgi:hypothetical protein